MADNEATAAITDGGRGRDGLSARGLLWSVMSVSPLSMVLTDPHQPDYPVIFVNRAFTTLTGFSEKEALGRNCRFLQGPDTDLAAVRVLGDAVAAVGEAQIDLWNYRKDGSRFWNSMFVGPVIGRDGRLLYYFGSQSDATARREADEARSQAQRMDTLGSMAAGIAHEVNNLMTVIAGNAERLIAVTPEAKQLDRLKRIDWAARETSKLTQQMLSFAGRQKLTSEAVDLNDVLRQLDRLLVQVAASGRRVEVQPQREPVIARVDVGQLQLALINLVRNASDASNDGDRIVVASCSGVEAGAGVAEIYVRDEGSGMPPAIAAKATEPFFTTKAPGKGTGLGLSVVGGFCQQSGGSMVIETAEGQGTMVRLIFPQAHV
jgi:PAS domain S-box-containing protein